jgi:quaternary ammonium compound-resistance protein SugE
MAWIYLTVAGLFEIGWAIGLKYTDGFTRLLPSLWTLASMILSIVLLGLALRTLPVGTAYAVWTGIGAVGPPRSASICSRSRQPWRGCCASD